jgi:hypothetical protein
MAFAVDYAVCDDPLDEELQCADQPTADLFAKIIDGACRRVQASRAAGKTIKIYRFIESGAWIDAALALIEIELPAWKVRRLGYEGGAWCCTLSRQPDLPAILDDSVDGHHDVAALAILRAFIEARRWRDVASERRPTISQLQPISECAMPECATPEYTICCDNFA